MDDNQYTKTVVSIMALILILALFVFMRGRAILLSNQSNSTILLKELKHQTYIDSLYIDHLEKCSFVSRDEVKTDSRGYFYSTYQKGLKR